MLPWAESLHSGRFPGISSRLLLCHRNCFGPSAKAWSCSSTQATQPCTPVLLALCQANSTLIFHLLVYNGMISLLTCHWAFSLYKVFACRIQETEHDMMLPLRLQAANSVNSSGRCLTRTLQLVASPQLNRSSELTRSSELLPSSLPQPDVDIVRHSSTSMLPFMIAEDGVTERRQVSMAVGILGAFVILLQLLGS